MEYCLAIKEMKYYILIYYNMDETCKHYAKWKKPVMKDHKLYSSIYMNSVEQANG